MRETLYRLADVGRRLAASNPVRKGRIRRTQAERLGRNYPPDAARLIVLLVPGLDKVNGGILSITSIYGETRTLRDVHHAETILCTLPGDPLLLKYTRFQNTNDVFEFPEVLEYFHKLRELTIHVPEYAVDGFLRHLSPAARRRLSQIAEVKLNILMQNVSLMPSGRHVAALGRLGPVTCTTAHAKYSTPDVRARLGVPLHKLSVFNSPEQYERRAYQDKDNLMVVSPDDHPRKRSVLRRLARDFPDLEIRVVRRLSYEEYKDLIARARWALTFGEGLDGYFLETVLSGGISFAVYNPMFHTEDFRGLRTVYDSYDTLSERISPDVASLDSQAAYAGYQSVQYRLCASYYRHEDYVANLRRFYEGKYTLP